MLLFSWLKETFSASFVLYGASELENRCEHSVILHFLPLLWGVKAPFAALYYSRVTPLVYLMESPRGGICHDLPSSVIVCGVQFPVSCRQFHVPTVTSPVPSCPPPVAHLQLPLLLFVPFRSRNGWPSSNGVPFAAVFPPATVALPGVNHWRRILSLFIDTHDWHTRRPLGSYPSNINVPLTLHSIPAPSATLYLCVLLTPCIGGRGKVLCSPSGSGPEPGVS